MSNAIMCELVLTYLAKLGADSLADSLLMSE